MSVISIPLATAVEHVLRTRAESIGLTLETYLSRLAHRDAGISSFDDPIFESVQRDFVESGMTEDELAELVASTTKKIRSENINEDGYP